LIFLVNTSDWYISPFGDDGSGTGSETTPFQTLFRAVTACKQGDRIVVMPGSYQADGTINPAITIISQGGLGTAYFVNPSLTFSTSANITGMILFGSGGVAFDGEGCNPAVYVLTNCRFNSNDVAISNDCTAQLNVINCTFMNNQQDITSGRNHPGTTVTIIGSTFQQSSGILISYSQLSISDSLFSGNINPSGGAAISVTGITAYLKNTRFINCSTTANGGAIFIDYDSTVNIISCIFSDNSAQMNGGAVYIQKSSILSVFNSDFNNNQALSGGAYACDSTGHVQQVDCTFENSSVGSCLNYIFL
jgi:hypothetical protein